MRWVIIGAHLLRDDVEPLADAIAVGELFLSGVPIADEQPVGDRALLLRVAAVRARLLERATFVAIRYGMAVATAEQAHTKAAAHLARWKVLLERHRDHVEMTLKVAAHSALTRPDRRDFSSGADYLRALHATVRAAHVDSQFRDAVERGLAPLAVTSRWQTRDEKSVEWNALVARERVGEVNAAGERLREEHASTPFLLSGPWPLEVFAEDDHE
jgi:hypothetical protein